MTKGDMRREDNVILAPVCLTWLAVSAPPPVLDAASPARDSCPIHYPHRRSPWRHPSLWQHALVAAGGHCHATEDFEKRPLSYAASSMPSASVREESKSVDARETSQASTLSIEGSECYPLHLMVMRRRGRTRPPRCLVVDVLLIGLSLLSAPASQSASTPEKDGGGGSTDNSVYKCSKMA